MLACLLKIDCDYDMNIEPLSWEEYAARPSVRNSALKVDFNPTVPAHYRARFITGQTK